MTINDALLSVYPDQHLYGTRTLGRRYYLSEGMRGYTITNSFTGKVVCTWDEDGVLYATTNGLTPHEKSLITRVLKMWRGTRKILWQNWDTVAVVSKKLGREFELVGMP